MHLGTLHGPRLAGHDIRGRTDSLQPARVTRVNVNSRPRPVPGQFITRCQKQTYRGSLCCVSQARASADWAEAPEPRRAVRHQRCLRRDRTCWAQGHGTYCRTARGPASARERSGSRAAHISRSGHASNPTFPVGCAPRRPCQRHTAPSARTRMYAQLLPMCSGHR